MFKKDEVYRFLSRRTDPAYYGERTDRNIGWITLEEQAMVRRAVVGVAGCGGMGGQLAEKFLRLGIGEIRIADNESFDISNINRQFAATMATVGMPKAFETAKMMRSITDDATILVYPQGVCEEAVFDFVHRCDVVCDEIEFWCVGSRILLHRAARECGVPVFVCNSLGFGSQLFLFTPQSMTMEECMGLSYEEAVELQKKLQNRTATAVEVARAVTLSARTLCSEWPEYCHSGSPVMNRPLTEERLLREGRGAVIATNLPLACGLIADRVLLYLLKDSPVRRNIVAVPEMPGYCYLDAATMEAKVIRGRWW